MVMGGIVPVVNIDGMASRARSPSTGRSLAKIFLGEIKTWNDPAIAKLNPGVKLPSAAISVVHRSDGSGTTFNFTRLPVQGFGRTGSPRSARTTAVKWPTGLGAKGNEGVAANVKQTGNSIGYVEYAYAMQNKLTYADMINHDGQKVAPVADAFAAAAAGADWTKAPGFYLILTDQAGAKSWPITASTFILMPTEPTDPAAATAALKFFDWAYQNGDDAAKALDYIPMPKSVVELVKQEWSTQIKGQDGKPLQF